MTTLPFFTDSPALAWPLLMFLAIVLLSLARTPSHRAITASSRILSNALRLAARSLRIAEERVRLRNREVLLAEGMESVEKELEREFQRVDAVVKRDLQSYPAFHRNMADLITRIDEDYRQSTEVPPSPPSWVAAIEAVARVENDSDGGVAVILAGIHKTLEKHHKGAMDDYRQASRTRHGLLNKMMPFWRKLSKTLEEVGKTITGLQERSLVIDSKMAEYEGIRAGADSAVRRLSSSSLTQFTIAGLVMLIAIGGAVINFNLIALPMSEMVGGGSYIGPYKTSDVAALVIILVEVSMGLFLMESLRITRLFPIIGMMDDKMRRRMIWISFSILLTMAGVESALAFMRDRIAADLQALRQSLSGAEAVVAAGDSLIPTVGQMVMGFILPFALTFVAIPLESFIHSSRTVLGVVLATTLRALTFVLRLAASLVHYLGKMAITVYDLLIFPTLWVEDKISKVRREPLASPAAEEAKP